MDGDALLTADEVAALLAVSVRSVRRYAEEGRLVPVRLGRRVRYRPGDVERLRAGATMPPSGQASGQDGHSRQRTPDPATAGQDRPAADTPDLAAVSLRAIAALREELVALREENTTLRQEVAAKAEAAGLWQGRARTLEEQLKQLTAPVPAQDAPRAADSTTEASVPPAPPDGLWARLGRWWRGAGGGEP